MNVLGWFLAICGVAGLVFALRMMKRMKKMQTVPFKLPSEIAAGGSSLADSNGMISTEGQAAAGPLLAPMSGKPCLAWKLVIERKWEDEEETENGTKTKRGSDKLHEEYRGGQFRVSDSKGAVGVDVSSEPEAEFVQAHSSTVKIGDTIPRTLSFGGFGFDTPRTSGEGYTVAFVGSEKILEPGNWYVLGALQNGVISKPAGVLGKLLLSNKGRAAQLQHTRRNMRLGYALGGALAFGGTLLGLFGPKVAHHSSNACAALTGAAACEGRIRRADGEDIKWTVPHDGKFLVAVHQPNVKRPIDAVLTVLDSTGAQVAFNDDDGHGGLDAAVEQSFAAGTYTINVRDYARRKMSGGQGYSLVIQSKDPLPAAMIAAPPNTGLCDRAAVCCHSLKGAVADGCEKIRHTEPKYCENMLAAMRKAAKRQGRGAACD